MPVEVAVESTLRLTCLVLRGLRSVISSPLLGFIPPRRRQIQASYAKSQAGWRKTIVNARASDESARSRAANLPTTSSSNLSQIPFPIGNGGGDPTGIRTPVTAVKGRCPRPLDDRVRRKERGICEGVPR